MKKLTIFFDLEGWWEAPYKGIFDLNKIVKRILSILNKHKIKAVFNTCGVVGEFFPELLKKIDDEGHEIASHGYKHENFSQLRVKELNNILLKTEKIIEEITGKMPIGIRSPWGIHNKMIYSVFRSRDYKWASNEYLPFPELFEKPKQKTQLMYAMAKYFLKFQHKFFYPRKPYKKDSILEIPMLSSMDADLLSIVSVEQNSPSYLINYAYNVYKKQFLNSKKYFNLNFHPWLIGSANRPILLDNILNCISKQRNVRFVLAKELIKND